MEVVVPYDAVDPKTRLAPVLDAEERSAFAAVLLADVLASIRAAGHSPTVYATAPIDVDADVVIDERGLDALFSDLLADPPLAAVMADLGLLTPAAVERFLATEGDVVAAPGLGGGTNALLARRPGFETDFHGVSVRDHRRIAREHDLEWNTVDHLRLSVDVDEPDDLVEVLLHGEGEAPAWLRDHGVRVAVQDGRATVERSN